MSRHTGPYTWICTVDGRAADGPTGANGKTHETASVKGSDGKAGAIHGPALGSHEQVEVIMPLAHARRVLRAAQIDYFNGNIQEAISRFSWLAQLAKAGAPERSVGEFEVELAAAFLVSGDDCLEPIGRLAEAYLVQLSAGCDIFGHQPDDITLLRRDLLEIEGERLLRHAESIDSSLKRIQDAELATSRQQAGLSVLKQQTLDGLSEQKSKLQSLQSEKDSLDISIDIFSDDLNRMLKVVDDSFAGFKADVEARSGCSLLGVAKALGTIVAFAADGYKGIADFAKFGGEALKLLRSTPRTWENDTKVAESLKKAGKGVLGFTESYQSIAGELAEKPDSVKLILEREELKALIKPYIELATARNLEKFANQFIDSAIERNRLIVRYTQILIDIDRITTQIHMDEVHLSYLRTESGLLESAKFTQYTLPVILDIAESSRLSVIENLYEQCRVLRYWALTDTPLNLDNDSIEVLNHAFVLIRDRVKSSHERIGRSHQAFSGRRTEFSQDSHSEFIANFRSTGRLTFTLKPTDPEWRGLKHVYVTEFNIKIEGAFSANRKLFCVLRHHGNSLIQNGAGNSQNFSHMPRTTIYEYDLDGHVSIPGDLGSSETYAELSPFATWSLELNENDNVSLDLRNVTSITIEWSGLFVWS